MKFTVSKSLHHRTILKFLTKEDLRSVKVPDFGAEKKDITVVYEGKNAIIYCGLGDRDSLTQAVVRSAAAAGIRMALSKKRSEASITVPPALSHVPAPWAPILEGVALGAYSFVKYKKEKGTPLTALELCGDRIPLRAARRVLAVCGCVNYCRDLVNENAHIANPEFLVRAARVIAKSCGARMRIRVLDEKEIQKKGLRLLAAVGQGSPFPPRLAIIEYKGDPRSNDRTAIVGKGITFDSGGQNLKPTGHIETMRQDMAGAAAVLGVMKAIGELKPEINVIGVCPLAHNAIGGQAYFPGDIYKAYNGTTVEIQSTDAEGRLVLADAIAYCKDACRPSRIIDLATLTGGILTSLGSVAAGLFSNNDGLAARLFAAGETTGERLWRFPLYEEYTDSIKSEIADLRNVSSFKKGWASSITGAAFIGAFADTTPWAHCDIAGTAFNEESARGELARFATGFGVRLLLNFLGVE